jgi:hypothetical protein
MTLSHVHDAAGVLGAAVYLGSYGALQLGFLTNRGYAYPALNLVAASLMLTSLMGAFNPWSATIETCWILFSIVGLARWYFLTSGLRLSAEERLFVDTAFPGLEPYLARRVLAAGDWGDAVDGMVLTQEDRAVDALVYILSGAATVRVGGREVGLCGPGTLVGELGVSGGKPAIATVVVSEPARIFTVPAGELRQLMTGSPDIRIALDAGIGAGVRSKFISSNTRAATAAGGLDLAAPV